MDFGLKDATAFVAGASSGLGLAAATELAREGCRVAICSRDRDRIESAAGAIRGEADGADVLPLVCDVTDEHQIDTAIRAAVDRFGFFNILVTNAGGPPAGFIGDFDAEAWRAALELNLMSTINLTRGSLPHLRHGVRENGLGRIIMITSVSAKQPIPNLYLSNVSRAGVQGFAKSLSEEVGSDGITVNTLLPGFTRTARLQSLSETLQQKTSSTQEEVERQWADATALKRIGEPEEFAAALAFLAGRRSGYITGVALPVDGGRSKHVL